jgi:regulator of sigma E protease
MPFPALDGGRFVFLGIEGIRGKPINRNVEAYINFAGIIILFAFMILITFKDIIKLIF